MSHDEARFFGFTIALADIRAFASMSELHAVLRLRDPKGASDWSTDDVWCCLSSRIGSGRARPAIAAAWEGP
jgi:hypothetical protein